MIAWYKKDKDVQLSLSRLANVRNTIQKTPIKDYPRIQPDIKDMIYSMGNSSLPFEHLRQFYDTFGSLFKAIDLTISDDNLTKTNAINISIDIHILVRTFGSKKTIENAIHTED